MVLGFKHGQLVVSVRNVAHLVSVLRGKEIPKSDYCPATASTTSSVFAFSSRSSTSGYLFRQPARSEGSPSSNGDRFVKRRTWQRTPAQTPAFSSYIVEFGQHAAREGLELRAGGGRLDTSIGAPQQRRLQHVFHLADALARGRSHNVHARRSTRNRPGPGTRIPPTTRQDLAPDGRSRAGFPRMRIGSGASRLSDASRAIARASVHFTAIYAIRCCKAWKLEWSLPNCTRCLVKATVAARSASIAPTAFQHIAARRAVTGKRRGLQHQTPALGAWLPVTQRVRGSTGPASGLHLTPAGSVAGVHSKGGSV